MSPRHVKKIRAGETRVRDVGKVRAGGETMT